MESETMEELLTTFINGNQSYFRQEVRKMSKKNFDKFNIWLDDNAPEMERPFLRTHIKLAFEGK